MTFTKENLVEGTNKVDVQTERTKIGTYTRKKVFMCVRASTHLFDDINIQMF